MTKGSVKGTGSSPGGDALLALVMEIAATYFRLRAAGKRVGAVTPSGGGILGLLRSLAVEGPQTVPQLARSRPVARQHIQQLANEAARDGWVEFVDNPAHKRSKLVRLTRKGKRAYDELMGRMMVLAEELSAGMDSGKIRTATKVLGELKERLGRVAAGDASD